MVTAHSAESLGLEFANFALKLNALHPSVRIGPVPGQVHLLDALVGTAIKVTHVPAGRALRLLAGRQVSVETYVSACASDAVVVAAAAGIF